MPADPEQTARLRELHDDFAWKVNAAVAEGREDLIHLLCGEYFEQAVLILADGLPATGTGCGREDCEACRAPRAAPSRAAPPRRRRRWRSPLGAALGTGWPRHR
jgi:hypothetical protein